MKLPFQSQVAAAAITSSYNIVDDSKLRLEPGQNAGPVTSLFFATKSRSIKLWVKVNPAAFPPPFE